MLGGRLAGALVPLGVEMQTKQEEKERRSEKNVENVSSRTRNLQANERRADGCQPREMRSQNSFILLAVWLLQGKREKKGGGLGVSEAGGSQSARPLLGAVGPSLIRGLMRGSPYAPGRSGCLCRTKW